MIGHVMIALGAYRFSVENGGAQEIERTSKWRWAEQEVIGSAPVLQYTGPGCESMCISACIFPQYRGGAAQIDSLRAQAGLGQPMPLVDGAGYYYGLWVVDEISETKSVLMSDGAARKIEFRVSLKKYA